MSRDLSSVQRKPLSTMGLAVAIIEDSPIPNVFTLYKTVLFGSSGQIHNVVSEPFVLLVTLRSPEHIQN